jgi:hypothetical protein
MQNHFLQGSYLGPSRSGTVNPERDEKLQVCVCMCMCVCACVCVGTHVAHVAMCVYMLCICNMCDVGGGFLCVFF